MGRSNSEGPEGVGIHGSGGAGQDMQPRVDTADPKTGNMTMVL